MPTKTARSGRARLSALRRSADRACALLKALANPDRLSILCLLSEGERSVGELEASLDIVQPTLSQQLTVLRGLRLVATRREGRRIHYRLASRQALAVIGTLHEQFCAGRR